MTLDPRAWQAALGAEVAPDARAATRITFDSRQVNATTAFAALKGEQLHGNDFIAAALELGAPFVLTDLAVPRAVRVPDATVALRTWARSWRDSSGASLIGVTGSAGKTTAKELIAAALGAACTPGSLNTLNYLATYLLNEVEPRSQHVIEMGIDRIGEMAELMALVNPDIGIITSVGPAHLEFFGDLETIAFEKGQILQSPVGIVSSGLAQRYPHAASYGLDQHATYRGSDLELTDSSSSYTYAGQRVTIASPSHKVAEASVLALALAEHFNLPLETAIQRLERVVIPGGRMRIERGRYTLIDDTYNANPLSVTAALETLERQHGRRIAVLGDMRELGPDAPLYHAEIGKIAARAVQQLIAVGNHAEDYLSGSKAAGLEGLGFANADDATAALLNLLEPDDVVLVKGSRAVGLERVAEVLRARL